MTTPCARRGCPNPATHRAELVIYAISTKIHPPSIGSLNLCVCQDHATEAEAKLLLHDPGKRQIEQALQSAGRALPDWTRSFARWVAL